MSFRPVRLAITLSFTVVTMLLYYFLPVLNDPDTAPYATTSRKIILLWDRFTSLNGFDSLGSDVFERYRCPSSNCLLVRDRRFFPWSDAVLIHGHESAKPNPVPDLADLERNVGFGGRQRSQQLWVFVMKEPPPYSYFRRSTFADFAINVTMTYRLDSDITWRYGYFERRSRSASAKVASGICSKKRLVAWVVSRCESDSGREGFARRLAEFVPVDVFGHCSRQFGGGKSRRCGDNARGCLTMLEHDFKFYLAFENSLCQDYVTEKLFKVLRLERGPVPIILNGTARASNIERYAPPGSVIDAGRFRDVEALGAFLKRLDENCTAYEELQSEWRRHYRIVSWETPRALCRLCVMLNEKPMSRRYENVFDYWHGNACIKPTGIP